MSDALWTRGATIITALSIQLSMRSCKTVMLAVTFLLSNGEQASMVTNKARLP